MSEGESMTTRAKAKRATAQRELDGSITRAPENTFTTPAAARYLGVSASTLRFWRANGEGPRFFHAGDRLVRYRRVDCDAWIESRLSQ
jgi:predicted DNA-binding transcriptional regulator AlpA